MINKKIIVSLLLLSFLLIFSLNGILAYSYKLQICNPPILNTSCIDSTSVLPITNAPSAIMFIGPDGNLYITNDTPIQYGNNITNVTNIYVTNVTYTNVTYSYNLSNGTNITIIQNITANDTLVQQWLSSLNLSSLNSSVFNWSSLGIYTKNDTDNALNTELTSVQNLLTNYASKNDLTTLDSKYKYLLAISPSGINGSVDLTGLVNGNSGDFSMTWKVIIIIDIIITILLMIVLIKGMMGARE